MNPIFLQKIINTSVFYNSILIEARFLAYIVYRTKSPSKIDELVTDEGRKREKKGFVDEMIILAYSEEDFLN